MLRYCVSLLKVTGIYVNGEYETGGMMSFKNFIDLSSAKSFVSDEFKQGYFNYAKIYDRETEDTIFRFAGKEWELLKESA